jgi:HAD superfamily hydrolase (TIGR01509 family)
MPLPDVANQALPIPDRAFGAYLFDLDGTIADSMPLHLISWQQAMREHGGDFPEELFWAWGGVPLPRTVELLNQRFGYHLSPPEVVHRKEQLYLEMLDRVRPVASVAAHIVAQHGRIPMAVVSGSPRLSIERTLAALHLENCFDAIVGAEDYTHGKPDPEPFLLAARKLNVAPSDCLVFEDADLGIQAAEAAGMAWVRVPVRPLAAAS